MGQIYSLDFPNGKSYIGMTAESAEHRFEGHAKRARIEMSNLSALYSAWRKYGPPSLRVLETVPNEQLQAREVSAIKAHGTMVPFGYNLSPGGDSSPMKNPLVAAKVSASMTGDRNPMKRPEARAAMHGNTRRKGQPNSPEHNAKVSAALKGKSFTEEHKEALRKAWANRKLRKELAK